MFVLPRVENILQRDRTKAYCLPDKTSIVHLRKDGNELTIRNRRAVRRLFRMTSRPKGRPGARNRRQMFKIHEKI